LSSNDPVLLQEETIALEVMCRLLKILSNFAVLRLKQQLTRIKMNVEKLQRSLTDVKPSPKCKEIILL
jgi:hypothetical protein